MTTNGDGTEDWEVLRGERGKTVENKAIVEAQSSFRLSSESRSLSSRFTPHREAQDQSSQTPICAADKHGLTDLVV